MYIQHSTYVKSIFSLCQNSKLLLEIKKASKFHILNIKANGNNYHHCLLSSMIQHRSYTPQNEDTFLALKSERTHLLPCLSVSFPKNISTSFTSSPLTSPWVWERLPPQGFRVPPRPAKHAPPTLCPFDPSDNFVLKHTFEHAHR